LKEIIGRVLYGLLGQKLPLSYSRFNFGSRKFRQFTTAMFMEIGENVNVEKGASIGRNVILGDNSGIGINAYIGNNTKIGKNVMMGQDCMILTQNHEFCDMKKPMMVQGFQEIKEVTIEDDVWIGARVIILPGVRIHTGSVIGAGSVVTKDVPPYSIVGGNPAKVIKNRK